MKTQNVIKNLLLFTTSVCLLFGTPASLIAESGSDLRQLPAFGKVDISGAYKIILEQGDKEQILVEGDAENLPKVLTKVEGGTLVITNKEKNNSSGKITLTITFKNIDELSCSGAVDLKTSNSLKLNNFDLDLSGASKSDLDINAAKLDIDISGSANATLKGKVKMVDLYISGTGSLSAPALESDVYDIEISGVGNATVHAISKLDVSISGTGAVTYKGDPQITKEISGTGSLKKM